jgi:hypothetical protein
LAPITRKSAPLGIGNPLLDGPDARHAGRAALSRQKQACPEPAGPLAALTSVRSTASLTGLFRGGTAEIEGVRALPPLPETADELWEVGRHLGVPQSEILLGARATETALKALSNGGRLADYAILPSSSLSPRLAAPKHFAAPCATCSRRQLAEAHPSMWAPFLVVGEGARWKCPLQRMSLLLADMWCCRQLASRKRRCNGSERFVHAGATGEPKAVTSL